jgi:hypothetical protein
VLLIEQHAGFLDETAEGLMRPGRKRAQHISHELARSAGELRTRLRPLLDDAEPALDILLFCPDYHVRQPGSAGLDPARIVDASRRDAFAAIVQELTAGQAGDAPAEPGGLQALHRFFADILELVPDVQSHIGQVDELTTRLSGGLTEWARRIDMSPHRLRVTATAGSGKTQLALAPTPTRSPPAGARSTCATTARSPTTSRASRRPAARSPPSTSSATAACATPGASRPSAPGRLPSHGGGLRRLVTTHTTAAWQFDELIIDEGQDFMEPWRDALLALLKPGGRAWWLEDPLQNLYDRPPVPLPGWVGLSADTNYRTPADVLACSTPACRCPRRSAPAARWPTANPRCWPGTTTPACSTPPNARSRARSASAFGAR